MDPDRGEWEVAAGDYSADECERDPLPSAHDGFREHRRNSNSPPLPEVPELHDIDSPPSGHGLLRQADPGSDFGDISEATESSSERLPFQGRLSGSGCIMRFSGLSRRPIRILSVVPEGDYPAYPSLHHAFADATPDSVIHLYPGLHRWPFWHMPLVAPDSGRTGEGSPEVREGMAPWTPCSVIGIGEVSTIIVEAQIATLDPPDKRRELDHGIGICLHGKESVTLQNFTVRRVEDQAAMWERAPQVVKQATLIQVAGCPRVRLSGLVFEGRHRKRIGLGIRVDDPGKVAVHRCSFNSFETGARCDAGKTVIAESRFKSCRTGIDIKSKACMAFDNTLTQSALMPIALAPGIGGCLRGNDVGGDLDPEAPLPGRFD